MKIYNNMLLLVLSTTAVLLTGCSDDGAFETPASPTAPPPTGIADQNSFTLLREKEAVEGVDFMGVPNTVTVYVADRHNHAVPDDTIIRFLTNGGSIEPQCVTVAGSCQVTWTSQFPVPVGGKAKIIAYTEGEESFLDLNDNDAFDANEDFGDLSEPFIDAVENGTFDPDSEEFVDRDGDNEFDWPDGLYTGESCVGDVTVCNRTTLFVWGTTSVVMSSSGASIAFIPNTLSIASESSTQIIVEVRDVYFSNQMATGTTVKVEATDGTVDPSDFTVGNGFEDFTVTYKAPAVTDNPVNVTLTVTVTSPDSETVTVGDMSITVTPPPP